MYVVDRAQHWEAVYASKPLTELSWYERDPVTSLRLIEEIASGSPVAVIDIGAGASSLVDHLLDHGFTDLTVLDLSGTALAGMRERLGERAWNVTFVQHDVLSWDVDHQYDLWHDRAVFHFLTEETARRRYREVTERAIRVGGSLVLATFAEDGPTQCSGLPVARYSAQALAEEFSEHFSLLWQEREEHVTPGGIVQPFTWVVLRRI